MLRRVAAELGRHQVERQVARVEIVLRPAIVATVADQQLAATVRVEVLCRAQVLLEGLTEKGNYNFYIE